MAPGAAAAFTFVGADNMTAPEALRFECSLDQAPFTSCASPQRYAGLPGGSHSFRVRAVDTAGNVDPTPASYDWAVQLQLFLPSLSR